MRVWDVPVNCLCDKHLVAQHGEIHAILAVLKRGPGNRTGYSAHPEVKRWRGRLGSLRRMHDVTALEMARRGFNHRSPVDGRRSRRAVRKIESVEDQVARLQGKGCECEVWSLDA